MSLELTANAKLQHSSRAYVQVVVERNLISFYFFQKSTIVLAEVEWKCPRSNKMPLGEVITFRVRNGCAEANYI